MTPTPPLATRAAWGWLFFFFLIKQTNLVYSGSKYLTNFYLLKNTYLTKKKYGNYLKLFLLPFT